MGAKHAAGQRPALVPRYFLPHAGAPTSPKPPCLTSPPLHAPDSQLPLLHVPPPPRPHKLPSPLRLLVGTQEPPVAGNWGQKNFAAYSSSKIDAALDTLGSAEGDARTTAAAAAHDAIIDEYPATFLTSMNYHVGVEDARMGTYQARYIAETQPRCSGC